MQLAVQMYTVRDFVKTSADLSTTLKKISAIGYRAVQLSAVAAMSGEHPEVSAQQARQMLDDNGLACIATHRSWDALAKQTSSEIEFHQVLGCSYAAIGGIPGPYGARGAEGYGAWVKDAQPVAAALKAAGIGLGYHNHAFEFARVAPDYRASGPQVHTLYDVLIEDGGPDINLELDTYWVAHAGANPAQVIGRCANRLPVVHVKDKEVVGNDPIMAPVGEGNLDWPGILAAFSAAGTQWLAVEQDECQRDPFDCLRSSFNFLTGHSNLVGTRA